MRSRRGELMSLMSSKCGRAGLWPGRYSCVVAWDVVRIAPIEGEMMMPASCSISWLIVS